MVIISCSILFIFYMCLCDYHRDFNGNKSALFELIMVLVRMVLLVSLVYLTIYRDLPNLSRKINQSPVYHHYIIQTIPLYTSLDNFSLVANSTDVLIGSHPVTHQTAKHLLSPGEYEAPSMVGVYYF